MSHANNVPKAFMSLCTVLNWYNVAFHPLLWTPCLCVSYILSLLPNIIINAKSLKDYRRKTYFELKNSAKKQQVDSFESPRVSFKPLIILRIKREKFEHFPAKIMWEPNLRIKVNVEQTFHCDNPSCGWLISVIVFPL